MGVPTIFISLQGNDAALDFLKDVFEEIFELFPSQYIHIGGDEVGPKAPQYMKLNKCWLNQGRWLCQGNKVLDL